MKLVTNIETRINMLCKLAEIQSTHTQNTHDISQCIIRQETSIHIVCGKYTWKTTHVPFVDTLCCKNWWTI